MVIREVHRQSKSTDRATMTFTDRILMFLRRSPVSQLPIPGGLGILLGLYLLAGSSLPLEWGVLLAIAAICLFAIMIIGNLRRFLLAVILLDIPLRLDIELGYRPGLGEAGALAGWLVSATSLSLVALSALYLADLLTHKGRPLCSSARASLPAATYLIVVALSALAAHDFTLTMYEVFLLAQMFLVFFYVAVMVRTREDLLLIITLLMISLLLESVAMIAVRFLGHGFSFAGISLSILDNMRVAGTLDHPNVAAAYVALFLSPTLSALWAPLRPWAKVLALFTSVLGVVALVLTFSRGAWISFGASSMLLGWCIWRRGWLSPKMIIGVSSCALLMIAVFLGPIRDRVTGDDEGSAESRLPLMRTAYAIIWDHPILGVGANNSPILMTRYIPPRDNDAWVARIHNKYLLTWAETGTIGLVAYIWFLAAIIRRGWQSWKSTDRLFSALGLGLTTGVLGMLLNMLVEPFSSNTRPLIQMVWFVAGLVTAMRSIDRTSDRSGSSEGTSNRMTQNSYIA